MAKLTRESKLREKRMEKQARKNARKLEAANPTPIPGAGLYDVLTESAAAAAESAPAPAETLTDA